jgi:ABC-type dipeptide/oligopeptide/nickel transport system permease component
MACRITRHLLMILGVILSGALISASLVRFSPGFGTDEQQLDIHLNSESLQALHASRAGERNIASFYLKYLEGMVTGNLGVSHALGQPVSTLFRDRLPVTVRLDFLGLAVGWALALTLALSTVLFRTTTLSIVAIAISGGLLCIPVAALALLSVLLQTPGYLAIALIVFPKLYRYTRSLLAKGYSSPCIVTARAKGLGELRILFCHVVPMCAPSLLALAGVSLSMTLGATIPVEALCGIAGIGDLAWQAALSRDLPLLVNITVLVTSVTLLANSSADVIIHKLNFQQL